LFPLGEEEEKGKAKEQATKQKKKNKKNKKQKKAEGKADAVAAGSPIALAPSRCCFQSVPAVPQEFRRCG